MCLLLELSLVCSHWLSTLFLGLIHLFIVSVLFIAMVADVPCVVCEKAGGLVNANGIKGCMSCICGERYYCSILCQEKDWKELCHKAQCSSYPEYCRLIQQGHTKVEAARRVKQKAVRQRIGMPQLVSSDSE